MGGIFGFKNINLDIDKIKEELLNKQSNGFLTQQTDNINFFQARLARDYSTNNPDTMILDGNMITFNGQIYNYKELKETYLKNIELVNESDEEVLLHLLKKYGLKILHKLNGTFCFAYYDKTSGSTYLVNDRFGVKQLFYYYNENSYAFSSSEPILLRVLNFPFEINQAYIDTLYVKNSIDFEQKILNKNFHLVNAGEYIEITNDNKIKKCRYYKFSDFNISNLNINYKNKKEVIDYFENLLVDAIKLRYDAKIPIAMTLSGGTDTSVIYTLIKEKLGYNIKTFTYSNEDKSIDEYNRVKQLTEKYNDTVVKIRYSKELFKEDYQKALIALNAPCCISDTGYYNVYRNIHESGYQAVIEGHGSDEIFGYYYGFMIGIGQAIKEKKYLLALYILNLYKKNIKRPLTESEKNQIKNYLLNPKNIDKNLYLKYLFNLLLYLSLPKVLRYWDRLLADNSIEVRCPFLDYRVVEFALTLPLEYKVNKIGYKAILREILKKYNVDFIYKNNNKQGFTTSDKEVIKDYKDFLLQYYDKNRFNLDTDNFDENVYKACSIGFLENYYNSQNK